MVTGGGWGDLHLFVFRGWAQRVASSLCVSATSSREGLPLSGESNEDEDRTWELASVRQLEGQGREPAGNPGLQGSPGVVRGRAQGFETAFPSNGLTSVPFFFFYLLKFFLKICLL